MFFKSQLLNYIFVMVVSLLVCIGAAMKLTENNMTIANQKDTIAQLEQNVTQLKTKLELYQSLEKK